MRRQPTRKTLPGWLWMVAGILIGSLVMAVMTHEPAREPEPIVETVPEEPVVEPDNHAPRPRFDFYTLLKESEVILNDDGTTPQRAAAPAMPAPTLPPPSLPADIAENKTAAEPAAQTTPQIATPSQLEPAATSTPVPTPTPTPDREVTATTASTATPPPSPAPAPASEPKASRDVFLLQAGSFKSAADADNLRARLLLLNMQARVETVSLRPGETWHRVQVGPFNNTQSLADARNLLQQNGIASIQVKKTQ